MAEKHSRGSLGDQVATFAFFEDDGSLTDGVVRIHGGEQLDMVVITDSTINGGDLAVHHDSAGIIYPDGPDSYAAFLHGGKFHVAEVTEHDAEGRFVTLHDDLILRALSNQGDQNA